MSYTCVIKVKKGHSKLLHLGKPFSKICIKLKMIEGKKPLAYFTICIKLFYLPLMLWQNKLKCFHFPGFSALLYICGLCLGTNNRMSHRNLLHSGACIIKLITVVIYGFHNKLEYFSLNFRLGWKRSLGTNTLD